MSWKESAKELGSLAWSLLGVCGVIAFVLFLIASSIHGNMKKDMKAHYEKYHSVKCEHESLLSQ